MLRFFSKRVGRNAQKYKTVSEKSGAKSGKPNKNALPCTVTLLDQSDLTFDLLVSIFCSHTHLYRNIINKILFSYNPD